jgi:hypothetical protein
VFKKPLAINEVSRQGNSYDELLRVAGINLSAGWEGGMGQLFFSHARARLDI